MSSLTILRPGLAATVQDGGRRGVLAQGLTQGGAVDDFARRLGQWLLGNQTHCAAIELAQGGLRLRANVDTWIAVTGAPLPVHVDGEPRSMAAPIHLVTGAILALGTPQHGIYSYVSALGGIDVPLVFGARTTVVREGLGGLDGRLLQSGDTLALGKNAGSPVVAAPASPVADRTGIFRQDPLTLRYVRGFQASDVHDAVLAHFDATTYRVTDRRDRMASRLEGEPVDCGLRQLWSEATCYGAIQLPPDGQPIVLLNDRQTMGGYPKLGAVIGADCVRLAQARRGTQVRFEPITPQQADRVSWLEQNFARETARALGAHE